MQNQEIAAALEEIADLLEFEGANPFRVRAYRSGARKIQDLGEPAQAVLDDPDRSLTDLDGIGKDLAEKIATLATSGSLPILEELHAKIPQSVLKLLRIPGVGPKKAARLYKELKIENIEQLRVACQSHQVRDLKGFGAKTEEAILQGLDLAEKSDERIYWSAADEIVAALREHMQQAKGLERLEFAGSYRRGRETVGDLDMLAESEDSGPIMDRLAEYPEVAETIARGDTKMSIRLASGLQVDLRVVPSESFGAALQYFTGSKDHNVVLRGIARDRGLKINEWGVFRVDGDEEDYLGGSEEHDIYDQLDLPCFPPELRENRQEFEWAKEGELPQLIEVADIRGDLHMHTTATDGKASLSAMIEAAQQRGLEYIAITDHSQRVSMAGGLDAARLRAQWAEIDNINQGLKGIRVLKGIECDILEQGGMDLPDEVLAEADWVIASVHYGQNQSRAQITDRILEALENPYVCAIAHPTGRLINRRKPYKVDLEAVFQAAAATGKMLELNASPKRLDLNDIDCASAKRHGVPIIIDTDAHSEVGLAAMQYGINQARRAGLTPVDVANTRPLNEFLQLIGKE